VHFQKTVTFDNFWPDSNAKHLRYEEMLTTLMFQVVWQVARSSSK